MNPLRWPIQKSREVWGALHGRRARVLLYHSISDTPEDPFAVSPHMFHSQMQWLDNHGMRVISSGALLSAIRQSQDLFRTVVLTFDDALCDFYDTAMPILLEFHFPAVIFVPTGYIGRPGNWGKALGHWQVMDEPQLLQASRAAFELGSHSIHHARLPDLDDAALCAELQQSLAYLSQLTGQSCIPLAYPFGSCGARERAAARSAGYSGAYLAGGLWGSGKGSDLFALPREEIRHKTSMTQFEKMASGKMGFQSLING